MLLWTKWKHICYWWQAMGREYRGICKLYLCICLIVFSVRTRACNCVLTLIILAIEGASPHER